MEVNDRMAKVREQIVPFHHADVGEEEVQAAAICQVAAGRNFNSAGSTLSTATLNHRRMGDSQ
jgi:hypothetical protein